MGLPTDIEVFGFSETGRGAFARARAALDKAGVDVDEALALMEAKSFAIEASFLNGRPRFLNCGLLQRVAGDPEPGHRLR